ncbi:MAG: thioredoxin domain-containing protein [Magnetococcales bacterium]|nr:thioredoxin domain-containing protein [Magnetococcales bacterium]
MNRLKQATSPYLQQHASNPVNWYPWCSEALAAAKAQDKPIFLSIGYSACHWCHVMAHESFEDKETAEILNRDFINIKLDREERPDLDQIYQNAHHLIAQRAGGWPLSMFLTPDLKPIFAGTYFPKQPRQGMPAFGQILAGVMRAWTQKRTDVETQGNTLVQALRQNSQITESGEQSSGWSRQIAPQLIEAMDWMQGGFGPAPKFPHIPDLRLMLRHTFRTGDGRAAEGVSFTLDCMIAGGIHDQLGGGFARYSVDDAWIVPHFEKMLYDNAQLLLVLSECDALLGVDAERKRAREQIVNWLQRRMVLKEGGIAASLDADTSGGEGDYAVWTPEEINTVLSAEDAQLALAAWGIKKGGNFEGRSIPVRAESMQALEKRFGADAEKRLSTIADQLLQVRHKREQPGRDDKVLLGWNALMVRGLLRHSALSDDQHALDMARNCLEFVTTTMRDDQQGIWYAVWRNGQRHTPAFLNDYAQLADAFLEAALVFDDSAQWQQRAKQTVDEMIQRFSDPAGGFFMTPEGQQDVIVRPKSGFDDATPSGNGTAANVLARMAAVTGESHYADLARKTVAFFGPWYQRGVGGFGQLLLADDLLESGGAEVVCVGPERESFLKKMGKHYLPDPVCWSVENGEQLPSEMDGRIDANGAALCVAGRCLPAVADLSAWDEQLNGLLADS